MNLIKLQNNIITYDNTILNNMSIQPANMILFDGRKIYTWNEQLEGLVPTENTGNYMIDTSKRWFNANGFYYFIVNISGFITKPLNANIAFYQFTEVYSRLDPTCMFSASKTNPTDFFNWTYVTSRHVTNGTGLQYTIKCYNENKKRLNINIDDLSLSLTVRIYPLI